MVTSTIDQFDPDAYLKTKQSEGSIPQIPGTPTDSVQQSQFNPDQYLMQKQTDEALKLRSEYGGPIETAKALAEGVARGATLGISDIAETASGLSTPERIANRQRVNPIASATGNVIGGGALLGLTGGLAGPIEAGLGGTTAARVLGYGTEGALFGAGNLVSDQALGDPNINAQKVITNIGMGALLGGGLGLLSKGIGMIPAVLRRGEEEIPAARITESGTEPTPPGTPNAKPGSIDEMNQIMNQAEKYGGEKIEAPGRSEAVPAAERMNPIMKAPITDLQLGSLDNPLELKTMAEMPGKGGDTLRKYLRYQKQNLTEILDNSIKNIAPDYVPTSDAAEAGGRAAESLTSAIEANRKMLGPAIEAIKSTPVAEMDHLPGIIDYLTDKESTQYANPRIADMFDKTGSEIRIKDYDAGMGIDKRTYRNIKSAIQGIDKNPGDFEKLFNIRDTLENGVNLMEKGAAPQELSSAKAAMMDYIQDTVQKYIPDADVREIFRGYAVNENNANFIEKQVGAKIGDNWRSYAEGKPESAIIKKIFSNDAIVSHVKDILPKDEFNKLLSDHLAILRNDVTDKGVFSSNKFFSQMNGGLKKYALDQAFVDNPEIYQKIKDATTLMRMFPDDASINPSGTAKTWFQHLINNGIDPVKWGGTLAEQGKKQVEEALNNAKINAKLSGISDQNNKLGIIQRMIGKVDQQLKSGSKQIFSSSQKSKDTIRGISLSGGSMLSDREYDHQVNTLRKFSSNPQSLMDHLADNTEHMYQAAPNITQSLHTSVVKGVNFLNSKIPQPPATFPLSPEKWKPTQYQKNQFSHYYNAVNQPMNALQEIKDGTLSSQTMEALNAVHPDLLQEMRSHVMQNMKIDQARNLPYSTKVALSKFMGQPMDQNLTPQAMQINQMALNSQLSQEALPKQGRKVGEGGLKQLKLNALTQTQTQRLPEKD